MTGPLDSMAVATHWPFVRRNLTLARARPTRLALDALAELQFRATGELVRLGRARLRDELSLTPGEAGAVYNALVSLERRGVVTRLRDAGRRADAWGFRADVRRWRGMAWRSSGRDVERAVGSCVCSTNRAFAARTPGQGLTGAPHFWLAAEDHLRPPGLFLVDSRGKWPTRAATARRPGQMPVDSRGYGAGPSAPSFNSEKIRTSPYSEGEPASEGEGLSVLRRALPGRAWGEAERRLRALADRLSVGQAEELARMLASYRSSLTPGQRPGVPMSVAALEEFAASPAVACLEKA